MARTNLDNILTGSSLKDQERKFSLKGQIRQGDVSYTMFYITTEHENNLAKSSVYLNACQHCSGCYDTR